MAHRLCLRPGKEGNSACGGRQIWRQPEAFLQAAYHEGGFTIFRASGKTESCKEGKVRWAGTWTRSLRRCRLSAKRSEENTSELQSLMRNSYAVFCLKNKTYSNKQH